MTEPANAWIADVLAEQPSCQNPFQSAAVIGDNISYEVYSRQTAKRGDLDFIMSRGELVEFQNCPHRWRMDYKEEGTKVTEWGQLIDALLLCDKVGALIAVTPETYPDSKSGEQKPWNWNATFCKQWRDEREGYLIVKPGLFQQATQAVEILLADQQIAEVVRCSQKQVMVQGIYRDTDTSIEVPVRALIDLVPELTSSDHALSLIDLKTSNSAHPRAWTKHVYDYDLHTQAALYLDLWNTATGEQRDEFRHILQESYSPFEIAKRFLSVEFIQMGRRKYVATLKRYCACLAENEFPGYDDSPNILKVNGWAAVSPESWMETV